MVDINCLQRRKWRLPKAKTSLWLLATAQAINASSSSARLGRIWKLHNTFFPKKVSVIWHSGTEISSGLGDWLQKQELITTADYYWTDSGWKCWRHHTMAPQLSWIFLCLYKSMLQQLFCHYLYQLKLMSDSCHKLKLLWQARTEQFDLRKRGKSVCVSVWMFIRYKDLLKQLISEMGVKKKTIQPHQKKQQ